MIKTNSNYNKNKNINYMFNSDNANLSHTQIKRRNTLFQLLFINKLFQLSNRPSTSFIYFFSLFFSVASQLYIPNSETKKKNVFISWTQSRRGMFVSVLL